MMNAGIGILSLALAATAACQAPDSAPADTSRVALAIDVKCDQALGIDSTAATRTDWGGTSEWTSEVHGDSLLLSRRGRCGDECNYEERIVFASIASACPVLVGATITKRDSGSPVPLPRVQEARRGELAIQDWHPAGGVVSGRLDAEFSLVFYVTTPSPPSTGP